MLFVAAAVDAASEFDKEYENAVSENDGFY